MRTDIRICPSLMGLNPAYYRAMVLHCKDLAPTNQDRGNHWFSDLTFTFIGM